MFTPRKSFSNVTELLNPISESKDIFSKIKDSDIKKPFSDLKDSQRKIKRRLQEKARQNEILKDHEIDEISRVSWLTSSHINAVLALLRERNPEVGGLYNVDYGVTANFPPASGERWLQILHDGNDHWLVAAFGFFPEFDGILIFDSLQKKKFPSHILACCASLIKTTTPWFKITAMYNQKQKNGYDCGIFAVAFATSLIDGENPCKILYDSFEFVSHFGNHTIDSIYVWAIFRKR